MMGQQRPQFDHMTEMARQQNLLKIQQLRQTLEAAQQQEAQYKSQLEVNVCIGIRSTSLSQRRYKRILIFVLTASAEP